MAVMAEKQQRSAGLHCGSVLRARLASVRVNIALPQRSFLIREPESKPKTATTSPLCGCLPQCLGKRGLKSQLLETLAKDAHLGLPGLVR